MHPWVAGVPRVGWAFSPAPHGTSPVPVYPTCLQVLREPQTAQWKNPPANAGKPGSLPGLGRSPGGGSGNPLQYSCLENSHGQENPSGQKQIKAHTLQIGGLPQLARRLEFSAALIEKSLSFLLPISLSPFCKRKSHRLQPSGRPLSSRSVPGWRLPGSEKKDQPGAGVWGGGLLAWASISLPHPSRLRCAQ